MNYSEWKEEAAESFADGLRDRGFVPEATEALKTLMKDGFDIAYNYGIKEAVNDSGES